MDRRTSARLDNQPGRKYPKSAEVGDFFEWKNNVSDNFVTYKSNASHDAHNDLCTKRPMRRYFER